jgi:alginate O-acetyltransferase complex protein AlgJ
MANNSRKGIRRILNITLCFAFVIAIWLPLAASFLGLSTGAGLTENRTPAPMPDLDLDFSRLAAFPQQFERYYNDNFGLRSTLVQCLNTFRSHIEGVTIAGNVLVGRDGWLYYTAENNIEDYRGLIRISEEQLRRMASNLEERRRWLAAFGCRYLLVIVPTKWEIYPEHMPANINRVSKVSRFDQIVSYLRQNSKAEFIELRTPLLEVKAKDSRLLYHPIDTHWNQLGAFIAVREINKKLSEWYPQIKIGSLDDYSVEETTSTFGNLAEMMGLRNLERTDYILHSIEPRPEMDVEILDSVNIPKSLYLQPRGVSLPTAVFSHDSSGDILRGFLSYSFKRCFTVGEHMLDPEIIEQEHPDIVIEEIGQRTLAKRFLRNSTGIAGSFSSSEGKSSTIHYPPGIKSLSFTTRALGSHAGRQFILLRINGKEAGRWEISDTPQRISLYVGPFTTPDHATVLDFGYERLDAAPVQYKGFTLPFRVWVENGGEDPNRCSVGVNDTTLPRNKGYNAYFLDQAGATRDRGVTFNTSWSEAESRKFDLFLRKARRRSGYLLLVTRYFAGRHLTESTANSLHRLGCEADLRKHTSWNHIALVDLSNGRLIEEKFGPGKQVLDIGGFDDATGFRISDIKTEPEPQPPPE